MLWNLNVPEKTEILIAAQPTVLLWIPLQSFLSLELITISNNEVKNTCHSYPKESCKDQGKT